MAGQKKAKHPPPFPERRVAVGICALLGGLVFVIFSKTFSSDFVNFDDKDYFSSNPMVQAGLTWKGSAWAFKTMFASNWHPLTWLSLMLDAQWFGPGARGPHLTNVILHAVNAILLFVLLKRLTRALWSSAFVATAFAVHPLHVESVAWISERKDVLSGLFFILTVFVYSWYVEKKSTAKRWQAWFPYYFFALLLFGLGLMSKPMLVTLPFVLLLLDFWPLRRFETGSSFSPRATISLLMLEKLPFFLMTIASCVLTVASQQEATIPALTLPLPLRIENALVSYVIYLWQMICPVGLAVFYPHPKDGLPGWEIASSGILLAGLTAGTFALRRKHPYLLVGWLWYLGTLVPVIGLFQVGGQARADRYTYLPLIGIFIMVAWGAKDLFSARAWKQPAGVVLAGAALIIATVFAARQASYWHDSDSLWTHALDVTVQNYVAHNGLGITLADRGQNTEAIEQYQRALEINPDFIVTHNNIGIMFARLGQYKKAIEHYQQALATNPRFVEAHINLGNALAAVDRPDEAIEHFRQALALNPDSADAENNWGAMLLAHGQINEAIGHLRQAAELMPDNAEMQINLGTALAQLGHASEAIEYYQKALKLKPDYAKAHYNLANIYAAQGELDEAIAHYQQAVDAMPGLIQARYHLGLLLQGRGKYTAAVLQFDNILELDPKNIAAQNDLAWLLATCPVDPVRDGQKAVKLAEQAVQLSGGRTPEILDTLAAAYAETGRFTDAIQTAHRAIAISNAHNNDSLAKSIQTQVEFYTAHQPYRDRP